MRPPERADAEKERVQLRLVQGSGSRSRQDWSEPCGPFLGLERVMAPGEDLLVSFDEPTTVEGMREIQALNVRVERSGRVTVVLISGLDRSWHK